jgi:hypothetical protein
VIRLRDSASASRNVIGLPDGGTSSLGRQISPPFSGISTGWSMKVSSGVIPLANAAPYTNGLNVEPGWPRLCDVIERLAREIAAADPRANLPVARIDGDEAGLHVGLGLAQRAHEAAVGRELLHRGRVVLAGVLRRLVFGRLAHEGAKHLVVRAATVAPLHALFAMPCSWFACCVSACVAIC